jgi:acyl-CoA oxidase
LNTIHDALPDLLEHGILTPSPAHSTAAQIIASPIEVLRTTIDGLAQKLLPEAIAIVDGFGFSDYDLDTALGRFDGRSYETLLERAMENEGRNSGGEDARKKM